MAGLARICKQYGSMTVTSGKKKVRWIFDYVNNLPRLEKEMTKEEIAASQAAREKWKRSA